MSHHLRPAPILILLAILAANCTGSRQANPGVQQSDERESGPAPSAGATSFMTPAFAWDFRPGRMDRDAGQGAAAEHRLLHMNLCNSGRASCYREGQVIAEAIELLRSHKPDLVTLNEICLTDVVDQLWPALRAALDDAPTYYAFQPALDYPERVPSTCTNGAPYGIAIIGRSAYAKRERIHVHGESYPVQDRYVEDRVWLCVRAEGEQLACTTHLSSRKKEVARAQCAHLMTRVLPALGAELEATVVAADLNLEARGSAAESAQACVPVSYSRVDDGDVQHVITSSALTLTETAALPLQFTDHPALLTTFTLAPAGR
jgi:endonuclease/exonuclease/phosphatase family metal-dependent hydrolase